MYARLELGTNRAQRGSGLVTEIGLGYTPALHLRFGGPRESFTVILSLLAPIEPFGAPDGFSAGFGGPAGLTGIFEARNF